MYNVDYFIKKFEAIPEENWCTNKLWGENETCCALGHCLERGTMSTNEEVMSLIRTLGNVVDINNGVHDGYKQPTPKQRILAALYDVKKLEQPQYDNITKEIAALPIQQEVPDVNKISWLL